MPHLVLFMILIVALLFFLFLIRLLMLLIRCVSGYTRHISDIHACLRLFLLDRDRNSLISQFIGDQIVLGTGIRRIRRISGFEDSGRVP